MRKLPETNPDLVVTDLSLSGKPGLELVKEIRAARPTLPILVLSIHDEELWAERVIGAAQGYVDESAGDGQGHGRDPPRAGGRFVAERKDECGIAGTDRPRTLPGARPVPWRDCLIASWKYSR